MYTTAHYTTASGSAVLTAQIHTAISNVSFLCALEDPDFGFSNITPSTMLMHLRTEYGTVTSKDELAKNGAALSEPWNLDDPIEDL